MMQGLSLNEEELYKVEKEIIDFCASEEVKCQTVKGPSYEHIIHGNKDYLADSI